MSAIAVFNPLISKQTRATKAIRSDFTFETTMATSPDIFCKTQIDELTAGIYRCLTELSS